MRTLPLSAPQTPAPISTAAPVTLATPVPPKAPKPIATPTPMTKALEKTAAQLTAEVPHPPWPITINLAAKEVFA